MRISDATVWGENADRNFPNAQTMVKWADQPGIVPFLTCISEKEKKRTGTLPLKKMGQETTQEDGTCFETFRRIHRISNTRNRLNLKQISD